MSQRAHAQFSFPDGVRVIQGELRELVVPITVLQLPPPRPPFSRTLESPDDSMITITFYHLWYLAMPLSNQSDSQTKGVKAMKMPAME